MTSAMRPDSHKISMKIIEAIKQHPVLYVADVKGTNVKLQDFRHKVWQYISDELGLDSNWVKLRWKNLRDTYCRILKYKNKTDKGVRRKKWIFEDHLNFLKFPFDSDYEPQCVEITEEYIQMINNSNLSSEGLLEQLEDRNDEDYSEFLEVLENSNSTSAAAVSRISEAVEPIVQKSSQAKKRPEKDPVQQDINKYAQEIESKYRKIRPKVEEAKPNSYNVITTPLNVPIAETPIIITNPVLSNSTTPVKRRKKMNAEEENNETQESPQKVKNSLELFFDSMAQTVKRFPAHVQADVKMNICKVITDAKLKHLKNAIRQKEVRHVPDSMPKLVLIPCNMIDNKKLKMYT